MADFPSVIDGTRYAAGVAGGSSRGIELTSGSANVKGSWTELIASTAFGCAGFWLDIVPNSFNNYLLDVGIGAAASEQVIAGDILVGVASRAAFSVYIPISIPAGVRVAVRAQCSSAGQLMPVGIRLGATGFLQGPPLQQWVAYGATAADSGGISIDPGATIHTKGAYSQIVASTTYAIRYLYAAVGHQDNSARSTAHYLFDIAIGAAASEQIILPDLFTSCNPNFDALYPAWFGPMPVSIPVGTRLAVRGQSDGNSSPTRLFDVVLYGLG